MDKLCFHVLTLFAFSVILSLIAHNFIISVKIIKRILKEHLSQIFIFNFALNLTYAQEEERFYFFCIPQHAFYLR